ncbi:MAG: inositol monophosphatase family protein [Pseudomonadota bacterium]
MAAGLSDHDIEAALAFAGRLADSARTAIVPHFRALDAVEGKDGAKRDGFDPVTEADRGGESAMRALIEAERPEDGIVGEEFGDRPSANGLTWLLDPVDGTRAFVAGLPVWTTLIALCDPAGDPLIGVIDQPVLGERYLGWPGGAAMETAQGQVPLRVSGEEDLRQATIATTDPFILTPAEQGAWTHLRHTARIIRYGLDAYAYARLAAGTIDLVAETGLAPWDMGALIPVVRGAGGLACDWTGAPAKPGGQFVCASSQPLLDQALISLRRSAVRG